MFLRSALFACASMMMVSVAAPAVAETSAEAACEATSFRIYFRDGATSLDPIALQTIEVAERNVQSCGYAELRVTLDAADPLVSQRAEAIRAATAGRAWDAVRVEARSMTQNVSMRSGPDYAVVMMTPEVGRDAPRGDVGV